MAICKCKMCGGDLTITELDKVVECEYCGTSQTVPSADNEKKMTLFNRANRLRLNNEFDKAYGLYEQIAAEFPEEAEAYWGLCLCHYGIEYVDDPATGEKKPTCHRASFEKLSNDENYGLAMEYADVIAQRVYRREAQEIDRINEEILSISRSESPYDVFICYKETDEAGGRTPDSVMAQDVYDALTAKGYKVFFSRISLEDKLGLQYEPYIFAALNSAKIMLSIGTKYEFFHAVWVKNEWSRFLRLAAQDKSKVLIPCYKDMDPYDMPDEFKGLQAQDLGKLGAIQDLVRGVEKLLQKDTAPAQPAPQPAVTTGGANVAALLQRGNMALEDKEWEKAQEYFDRVLDEDPKNAEAYLGLVMAEGEFSSREAFEEAYIQTDSQWESDKNVNRVRQFADGNLQSWLAQLDDTLKTNREKRVEELTLARERIRPYQGLMAVCVEEPLGVSSDGMVNGLGVKDDESWNYVVSDWQNIVAIAAGEGYAVGLKSDGTVVATGYNEYGEREVSDWRDIVAVATGCEHTVGLKSDGTVMAVGRNEEGRCDVANWRDIVAISARSNHTVGLKSDGTVVAVGDNEYGQCEVSNWRDIVAVTAGCGFTIGLKSDGTVVAVGYNGYGQCNVSDWCDIVAIEAFHFTIGLKSDGTVVAVGSNEYGQCNVSDWRNIVAIEAGYEHTVGLKSDGTVVAVGGDDICDKVSGWKLFKTQAEKEADYATACAAQEIGTENKLKQAAKLFSRIKDYKDSAERAQQCSRAYEEAKVARATRERMEREEKERAEQEAREAKERAEQEARVAKERAEREARRAALTAEKDKLLAELPNLKGLFSGGKRKEVETRIAQINAELEMLGG